MTPSTDHLIYRTGLYSHKALEIFETLETLNTSYEVNYKKCPVNNLMWYVKREYDTNEVIFYTNHKSYYPYFNDHFEDYAEKFVDGLKKCIVRKLKKLLVFHPIAYFKYKILDKKDTVISYKAYTNHDWTYSFAINDYNVRKYSIASKERTYYLFCELKKCRVSVDDIVNMIDYFNGDESAKFRISESIVRCPLNPLEEHAKASFKEDLYKINSFKAPLSFCENCWLDVPLDDFIEKYIKLAKRWKGISSAVDEQIEETMNAFYRMTKEYHGDDFESTILTHGAMLIGDLLK